MVVPGVYAGSRKLQACCLQTGSRNPTVTPAGHVCQSPPPWTIGVSPEARLDPQGGVQCFEAEFISSMFEKEVKEETNF